ncbi:hypothetical protein FHX82_004177 [Amycolatopsis bartoniae]|uniref:Uncharacterized protein n=1 Tax=Amycolatopsis bartoniae TaxID=941986 RepID=A0A8H9MCA5_9PSEU|nr:hypothetical protein [Amycolatopsis bartoniae]MBB2937113.1 hypothetical protein [Amycolatopsis bartoniae]TVS98815.1 hypothetical protein FNH07_36600 [Amycolatopsis bartoniae]GHF52519.1 hypothetical protein GCM10017566_27360 [Amycolatopsis bartoniae]
MHTALRRDVLLLDRLAPDSPAVLREHRVVDAPVEPVFARVRDHEPPAPLLLDGWQVLDVRPGREVVYRGVAGFRSPRRHLCRVTTGFSVTPYGTTRTLLTCETRLQFEDEDAFRRFRPYWRLLRPAVRELSRGTLRRIEHTVS